MRLFVTTALLLATTLGMARAEVPVRPGCFGDITIEGRSDIVLPLQFGEERRVIVSATAPGSDLLSATLTILHGETICSEVALAEAAGENQTHQVSAACTVAIAKDTPAVFTIRLVSAPQKNRQISVRAQCF